MSSPAGSRRIALVDANSFYASAEKSLDPALAERVYAEELANYLADNVQAWRLQADGAYSRITPEDGAMPHSAQDSLLAQLCH